MTSQSDNEVIESDGQIEPLGIIVDYHRKLETLQLQFLPVLCNVFYDWYYASDKVYLMSADLKSSAE